MIIRQRLRQYPEIADDTKGVMATVVPYYEQLRASDLVMKALDKHCRRMAKTLPEAARRVVLDDLIAVVGADDELHAKEKAYLAAVYKHFGMDPPA